MNKWNKTAAVAGGRQGACVVKYRMNQNSQYTAAAIWKMEDSHLVQYLRGTERDVWLWDIQATKLKYLMINGYKWMWVIWERKSQNDSEVSGQTFWHGSYGA